MSHLMKRKYYVYALIPKQIFNSRWVNLDWGMELQNRALILDNNPGNSGLLTEVLAQVDVSAEILHDINELFELLEQKSYDLIFLDVMAPFANNYEILEVLSKNPLSQNIPIIFLNVSYENKHILKKMDFGCYDYITKPYGLDEIKTKVKNILKLKELQDERDCFIETVTHDLKTPVRSEIRAMDMLLNGHFGELNPKQSEVLSEILNSSNYMFFMLDSILSKYKLDQNKVKLMPVQFNINELIKESVRDIRILFENKRQSINICFENHSDEVFADYSAMKRIIISLLSNAIKFSKEESIIEIRVFDTENETKISFIDNGVGISSGELKNIFEYKKENIQKLKQVGSGLGLYISQKIIAMQGGKIVVESQEGEGSKFTVSLPKQKLRNEEKVLYG